MSDTWKTINNILRKPSKSSTLPTYVKYESKLIYGQNDICNAMNNHFCSIGHISYQKDSQTLHAIIKVTKLFLISVSLSPYFWNQPINMKLMPSLISLTHINRQAW